MNRISSGATIWLKRVLPALLVVAVLAGVVPLLVHEGIERMWFALLMGFAALAVAGFVFAKRVLPLADEVKDGGDFLQVRRGSLEERVELDNVLNVALERWQNSTRIVLRLRRPGRFGDEVAFLPRREFKFNPFGRNAIAEDLMRRVDRARGGG